MKGLEFGTVRGTASLPASPQHFWPPSYIYLKKKKRKEARKKNKLNNNSKEVQRSDSSHDHDKFSFSVLVIIFFFLLLSTYVFNPLIRYISVSGSFKKICVYPVKALNDTLTLSLESCACIKPKASSFGKQRPVQ